MQSATTRTFIHSRRIEKPMDAKLTPTEDDDDVIDLTEIIDTGAPVSSATDTPAGREAAIDAMLDQMQAGMGGKPVNPDEKLDMSGMEDMNALLKELDIPAATTATTTPAADMPTGSNRAAAPSDAQMEELALLLDPDAPEFPLAGHATTASSDSAQTASETTASPIVTATPQNSAALLQELDQLLATPPTQEQSNANAHAPNFAELNSLLGENVPDPSAVHPSPVIRQQRDSMDENIKKLFQKSAGKVPGSSQSAENTLPTQQLSTSAATVSAPQTDTFGAVAQPQQATTADNLTAHVAPFTEDTQHPSSSMVDRAMQTSEKEASTVAAMSGDMDAMLASVLDTDMPQQSPAAATSTTQTTAFGSVTTQQPDLSATAADFTAQAATFDLQSPQLTDSMTFGASEEAQQPTEMASNAAFAADVVLHATTSTVENPVMPDIAADLATQSSLKEASSTAMSGDMDAMLTSAPDTDIHPQPITAIADTTADADRELHPAELAVADPAISDMAADLTAQTNINETASAAPTISEDMDIVQTTAQTPSQPTHITDAGSNPMSLYAHTPDILEDSNTAHAASMPDKTPQQADLSLDERLSKMEREQAEGVGLRPIFEMGHPLHEGLVSLLRDVVSDVFDAKQAAAQSQFSQHFDNMEQRFAEVEHTITDVAMRFDDVEQRVNAFSDRVSSVSERFSIIEEKLRGIRENLERQAEAAAAAEAAALERRYAALESRLAALEATGTDDSLRQRCSMLEARIETLDSSLKAESAANKTRLDTLQATMAQCIQTEAAKAAARILREEIAALLRQS